MRSKNVANTRSIVQRSVLLLEGTALNMEQLPQRFKSFGQSGAHLLV